MVWNGLQWIYLFKEMERTYTSSSCLVNLFNVGVICDRIHENVHCSHIYKYLEIPFKMFNSKYLESALCYLHAILHKSVVIQDNSVGLLLNGLLAELPAILDSFSHYHKLLYRGGWSGVVWSHDSDRLNTHQVFTHPNGHAYLCCR